MSVKEELEEMKKEVYDIQEKSFALEIIGENAKTNKRQFIIIIVLIGLLAISISYIVFLLNDINTETNTIDIQDVERIDNSHIKIGDELWEKSN